MVRRPRVLVAVALIVAPLGAVTGCAEADGCVGSRATVDSLIRQVGAPPGATAADDSGGAQCEDSVGATYAVRGYRTHGLASAADVTRALSLGLVRGGWSRAARLDSAAGGLAYSRKLGGDAYTAAIQRGSDLTYGEVQVVITAGDEPYN